MIVSTYGSLFPAALAILTVQLRMTNGVGLHQWDGYVAGYIPGFARWFFLPCRVSIREPTSESNLSPTWQTIQGQIATGFIVNEAP
jgi:hypothetical protein